MPWKRELLFVTSNAHKATEIGAVLAAYDIRVRQRKRELEEPESLDQEKVAVYKAEQAWRLYRKPLIVEDTGVYFSAYKNFPGMLAKRVWLGLGFKGLFKLLKGTNRKARFKVVICFKDSAKKHKLFVGELRGTMAHRLSKPHAKRLPYEKLFVPNRGKKPLVELTRAEKNRLSHRGIAARKLGKWLQRHWKR